MIKVAVMSCDGTEVLVVGETDNKTIDTYYVKVNGQLYSKAYVIPYSLHEDYKAKCIDIRNRIGELEREKFLVQSAYHI